MKRPLCCLQPSCDTVQQLRAGVAPQVELYATPHLVLHKVLMEVDAKQGADDLAGSYPPSEEGEETSEENWSEDRPQRCEGLWQACYCGLDVLLHVVHALFIFIDNTRQHRSSRGHHQRWSHPGCLLCTGPPGEVPYKISRDKSIFRFYHRTGRKKQESRSLKETISCYVLLTLNLTFTADVF